MSLYDGVGGRPENELGVDDFGATGVAGRELGVAGRELTGVDGLLLGPS